ncbi:MAG: hypothetical protein ACKODK_01500, partial [Opitutaceae bacterium]
VPSCPFVVTQPNPPTFMNPSSSLDRRSFLASAGAGAATLALLPPSAGAADAPVRRGKLIDSGRKLNIACIGCGGKGVSDIAGVSTENIVALCDVDSAGTRRMDQAAATSKPRR